MRIGKYEFHLPTFQERVLEADTARSMFRTEIKYVKYDNKQTIEYYNAYFNEDKIRASIDDLVDASTEVGHYNSVEEVTPVLKKSAPKELCDGFGKEFEFDEFLPNILRNVCIAGFCPVETILQKGADTEDFSKCKLTIIRPDTIREKEGLVVDATTHEITQIVQNIGGKENVVKAEGNTVIVNFNYGQLGNDVRGLSHVRGVLNLLNTLNEATTAVNAIMKRYLSPIAIWRSRKAVELLKKSLINKEPGEDIYLGNLNQAEMQDKIVEFLQIDPRVTYRDWIEYLDRRIYSYNRANDLWYSKDATVASAETLDSIVLRHVGRLQRTLKRGVENYWYQPLVDLWHEGKECPRLNFGVEKTGVEDIQIEPFLTKGLELGYLGQQQYFDLLKQLGIKVAFTEQEPEEEEETKETEPAEEEDSETDTETEPKKEALSRHEGIPTGVSIVGKLDRETGNFNADIIDKKHHYPNRNPISKEREPE